MLRKFAKKVLHLLQIIVFLSESLIYCQGVKQFERNYIKLLIILKDPIYSRNNSGLPKMSKTSCLSLTLYYWSTTMHRETLVLLSSLQPSYWAELRPSSCWQAANITVQESYWRFRFLEVAGFILSNRSGWESKACHQPYRRESQDCFNLLDLNVY